MANPEHVAILQRGVKAWNQWCQESLSISLDLSGADSTRADLCGFALFPIRIDDAVMQTTEAQAGDIRRIRFIGDFREWGNGAI